MNPKHHEKLNAWCEEELSLLKSKGATDDFLKEPAFGTLLLSTVLEKHHDEIKADKDLAETVFAELVFKKLHRRTSAEWRARIAKKEITTWGIYSKFAPIVANEAKSNSVAL